MNTAPLPPVLAANIEAVNAFDLDAIVATFAPDAFVNDVHREFWGHDSIRAWAQHEIVGDHVTLDVTEVIPRPNQVLVRARYDGDYDKSNLPDGLFMTSYFTLDHDRIASLIILRNTPAPY